MLENQPTKIIVINSEDDKLKLTIHWDSQLEDWEQVFRVILKWKAFTDDSVNEFFGRNEFGEELLEPESDNEENSDTAEL